MYGYSACHEETAMAKLVYSAIMSLDGYTADSQGNFDWAAPDPEVHTFVNDLERGFGTYLYGRKMYETMRYWETFDATADQPLYARDYPRIWRAAAKVVYSRTLPAVSSGRTRIERAFDHEAVLRMKETAGQDISVGGADLASQALAAGLVDELHLFLTPVTVGGGTPALRDDFRSNLELLRVDSFASGVVHLQYRTSSLPPS
jgi:dihydrofolate reductase